MVKIGELKKVPYSEPGFQNEYGWYFYDETGDGVGPYKTETDMLEHLSFYADWLNDGKVYYCDKCAPANNDDQNDSN
jgi:hypothetical protein